MAFDILYGRLVVLTDDTSSIKNIHKIASAKGAADPGIESLNSINNLCSIVQASVTSWLQIATQETDVQT